MHTLYRLNHSFLRFGKEVHPVISMLVKLLIAALAVVVIVSLSALVLKVAVRLAVLLAKIAVRLTIAGLISSTCGLVLVAFGIPAELALGFVLLLLVPAIALVWKWLGPLSDTVEIDSLKDRHARPSQLLEPDIKAPAVDPEVETAWDQISTIFAIHGQELPEDCRSYCLEILRCEIDGGGDLHPAIVEQAMLIRGHVPALAAELASAIDMSSKDEGRILSARTFENMLSMGRRSAELLNEERLRRRDALNARNLHLSRRMEPPGGAFRLEN